MGSEPSTTDKQDFQSSGTAAESGLLLEFIASQSVNYAMQQNDVPVILALRMVNQSDSPLQNIHVCITTEPAFSSPWETSVSRIDPGEVYNLGIVDLALSHDFLAQLTERVVGAIHTQVLQDDHVITRRSERIEILAYDEWSGLSGIPEILAAFVTPNHPSIETVLSNTAALLGEWTGDSALSGYQCKDRDRILKMVAGVYTALQRLGIRYINPPASFEERGQKIRLPDRILENKLATCLDLAVLAAACLEQIGLHPLIAITDGHAFCGVWMDDECFADCTTDDVLPLRKRVELGEVSVFETTCISSDLPVSFAQAMDMGQHHLVNADSFRCTIDICRARKSRIRPLPLRIVGSESTCAMPTQPTSGNAEALGNQVQLPSAVPDIPDSPSVETPASRLDRWKRKLLDLTMHNRLINFRETKKTLPLICPKLASLEDALAAGERFRLYPRPTDLDDSQPRDVGVHRRRTGEDAIEALLVEEFEAHRLRASVPEGELNRRLTEIYREARTSLEENGANTLYLALGFLAWYEAKNSSQRRIAPIILIPLEIERRSVQEGFTICQGDDDPIVNITLLELLEKDYQLSIAGMDPIPQDEHGISVQAILNAFRKAVKMIDKWEVVEDAYIGHFSFTKFLMWRDLEVRSNELRNNNVVAHLVDTPHEAFSFDGTFPDADRLDDTHKPVETFCPLSADSSQLAAIYAAAEGKSFVLHGPPGTGKSQTITNLIAHALAKGKTVLFVSEKMAALSVVHHRLKQCGLEAYCLELHSNKSHKKEVFGQLERALNELGVHSSEDWVREADKLASLRSELNAYVRELHKPRLTGESLFNGISHLISLRDTQSVSLGWPSTATINRDILDKLQDIAQRMEVAASACAHPMTSVWADASCENWSPGWRNDVEQAIASLRVCCEALEASALQVGPILGLPGEWSERELGALGHIAKSLLDAPAPPTVMVTSPDYGSLNDSVTDWITHGQRRDALRKKLYERYAENVLSIDLDTLLKRLSDAEKQWLVPGAMGRWQVKRALSRVVRSGQQISPDTMLQDLQAACALRDEEARLHTASDHARELLGQFWHDGEADWNEVASIRDWMSHLRSLASQIAGTDVSRASALRECWCTLITNGHEQLSQDGPIGILLADYQSKVASFVQSKKAIESLLALDSSAAWGESAGSGYLSTIMSRADGWQQSLGELRAWCYWRTVRREAAEHGLQAIVNAYEHDGLPARDIISVFKRSYYQWWTESVIDSEPVLRGFFSREFERKIQQFRALDEQYSHLAKSEIQARLAARVPHGSQNANQNSEMGILQRQLQRQRGHMPIRQLFQRIQNLLPRLKPCLLMSPISVAQYLDPSHPPFDLVVFDEASQIPVWDAVGAIARGKEAIIVGDPKQLPPTNFFSRADDQEIVDDDVVEDLESILDDCIAAQLPSLHLRWHYRSRHESLIAFSNYHYYENSLFTFPSPLQHMGVSFRHVDGLYDFGKSRTNRAEADAVVAEILSRLKDPVLSQLTIGVVTFSMSQQTLIEDLLDSVVRANPEIEQFFNRETAPKGERVFIKNLENVQGDERDVVVFSICYGPNAQGKVSMNFGPLNRDGGERRLNVAVTRARQEILVFSTLRADQIDVSRTRARGVADLKSFLDYAERGQAALIEQRISDPLAECESPFEQQVCDALRDRGYEVHAQVGCSGYRIDLAVVDPNSPGRYLLGIECDGANYHRAKTARDRDRLREGILRDLGWQLHRIWSTDWWEKPVEELARIEAAIKDAKRHDRRSTNVTDSDPRPIASTTMPMQPSVIVCQSPLMEQDLVKYSPYQCPRTLGEIEDFYNPAMDSTIRSVIDAVVRQEGPVSLGLVAQRIVELWRIGRIGTRIRERIERLAAQTTYEQTKSMNTVFLWPKNISPHSFREFRVPGDSDKVRRGPADIPVEEVANAALYILKGQISLPVDDLMLETARLFGFQRTGTTVSECMGAGINHLVERGDALRQNGMVVYQEN